MKKFIAYILSIAISMGGFALASESEKFILAHFGYERRIKLITVLTGDDFLFKTLIVLTPGVFPALTAYYFYNNYKLQTDEEYRNRILPPIENVSAPVLTKTK